MIPSTTVRRDVSAFKPGAQFIVQLNVRRRTRLERLVFDQPEPRQQRALAGRFIRV